MTGKDSTATKLCTILSMVVISGSSDDAYELATAASHHHVYTSDLDIQDIHCALCHNPLKTSLVDKASSHSLVNVPHETAATAHNS